jgi:hypothetical protein
MVNESGVPRHPDAANVHDALLCDTVARHFPAAWIDHDAHEVALGFGDLVIACRVNAVHDHGATQAASLYFYLRGGKLGERPVFASISGYAETAEHAIITGGCNWCCVFGPVLRAGLGGEAQPEVARFEIELDGQPFRVFVDALDRALSTQGRDASDRIPAARSRFAPDSWLSHAVLASDRRPLLAADRPTVLGVFVYDASNQRTVEVKINGCDWADMAAAFAHAGPEPDGSAVLMRELAVAIPIGAAPPLTRESVERTLRGIVERARAATESAAVWPGAAHHGYALGAPLQSSEIAALEARIGRVPASYRDFLATVSEFGAGPGYGVVSPRAALQRSLEPGEFDWDDETSPQGSPGGVLCLAHAGCGVTWLLVVRGRHRGEVWVDARSSDGKVRRAAASFGEWYRDWLTAAVRDDRPWIQWDARRCATASVLSQLLTAIENEGISGDAVPREVAKQLRSHSICLTSDGSAYFAPAAVLDPCEACVALVSRFSPRTDVFQPGSELALHGNAQPSEPASTPPRLGWLSRLGKRLRDR